MDPQGAWPSRFERFVAPTSSPVHHVNSANNPTPSRFRECTTYIRRATGGFAFQIQLASAELGPHSTRGPTLLHDMNGVAFAFLSPGVVVEIDERLDDTWSVVHLSTRPDVTGVLRHARLGPIFRVDDDALTLSVGGEESFLDRAIPFDVLGQDGSVRAKIQANSATVLARGEEGVEIVAWLDLRRGPFDVGAALVHGVAPALPEVEEPPMGISGWAGGGRRREPIVFVAKGARLHSERSTNAHIAFAYHDNVSASLVERGAEWSHVEANTVWGPVRGYVRTESLRPPPTSRSFLSFDMAGSCLSAD